jgi:hypothetical protein
MVRKEPASARSIERAIIWICRRSSISLKSLVRSGPITTLMFPPRISQNQLAARRYGAGFGLAMNCQNRVKEDLRAVPFRNGDTFRERPNVRELEWCANAPAKAAKPR